PLRPAGELDFALERRPEEALVEGDHRVEVGGDETNLYAGGQQVEPHGLPHLLFDDVDYEYADRSQMVAVLICSAYSITIRSPWISRSIKGRMQIVRVFKICPRIWSMPYRIRPILGPISR